MMKLMVVFALLVSSVLLTPLLPLKTPALLEPTTPLLVE